MQKKKKKKKYALTTRYRASSLFNLFITQVQVSKDLKIEPRTSKCWMTLDLKR